jgi:predicted dehydrogenase
MPVLPVIVAERRLPAVEFERHFRVKYGNPLRKALTFLITEGPGATLRKRQSKQIERRIEADQQIVIALVELNARRMIGVTRDIGGALRFDPALLFVASGEELTAASLDAVDLSPRARLLLESWLPVPSCPLDQALPAEILAHNDWLRPVPSSAAATGARRERRAGGEAAAPGSGGSARAVRDEPSRRAVYLIGYGGYVREQIMPHFRGEVAAAVDYKAGLILRHTGGAVPVREGIDDVLPGIAAAERPLVIVSTYHSDHVAAAGAVLAANAGARVFIEKPPCVTVDEARTLAGLRAGGAWIDIGYNRRYAPFTAELRARLQQQPRPWVLLAEVKELKLPPTHWYFWPNQGSRVTGNICHWLDLFCHLVPAPVAEMTVLGDEGSMTLALAFRDGTLATIVASERGDDTAGVTERIQARAGAATITIDEFRSLEQTSGTGRERTQRLRRDKGHGAMYRELRRRWLADEPPAYPAEDIVRVAEVVARAARAVADGERSVHFPAGAGAASGATGAVPEWAVLAAAGRADAP